MQWKTPKRPVVSAIVPGQCSFLDLEKPARTGQILCTIVDMGRKAKLTVKVAPRDLRRGSAKDIAHLKGEVRGFATPAVAAALGHKISTYMNDVTASYVGDSDASIWTLRAESGFKDRKAPMVGQSPFIAKNPNRDEVQEYCAKKGWDADDAIIVRRVKRHLVEDQEEAWRIENRNAVVSTGPPAKKKFLTPSK